MIVVLNMMDEAEKAGIHVDTGTTLLYPRCRGHPHCCHAGEEYRQHHPCRDQCRTDAEVKVLYDHHIEAAIKTLRTVHALTWIRAIHALQGHSDEL